MAPSLGLTTTLLSLMTAVASVTGFEHFPVQTAIAADLPEANGWTPKPTGAPLIAAHELLKRQTASPGTIGFASSLCGYISGIASNAFNCPQGNYCAFDENLKAIGCCATSVSGSFNGCSYFQSTCLNSADFFKTYTSGPPQIQYMGWCTDATAPYCATFNYSGYYGYECATASGVTMDILASVISNTTVTTGSSNGTVAASTTGTASSSSSQSVSQISIPGVQSQSSSTVVGTARSTSSAGAAARETAWVKGAVVPILGGIAALL